MAAAPASTGTAARDAPVGSTGPATTANRLLPHPQMPLTLGVLCADRGV